MQQALPPRKQQAQNGSLKQPASKGVSFQWLEQQWQAQRYSGGLGIIKKLDYTEKDS